MLRKDIINQKEIKALKKEIVDEGAINVGYFNSSKLLQEIIELWPDLLPEYVKEVSTRGDLSSIVNRLIEGDFISYSVQKLNYQEFKSLGRFFFTYEMTDEEILAEPVTITRENFERLQERINQPYQALSLSYQERLEQLTTMIVPNGQEPLAIDPISKRIAILDSTSTTVEPTWERGLINDYRSKASYSMQVAKRLLEENPNVKLLAQELYINQNFEYCLPFILDDILEQHPEFDNDYNLIVFDTGTAYQDKEWDLNGILSHANNVEAFYSILEVSGNFNGTKEELIQKLSEAFSFQEIQDFFSETLDGHFNELDSDVVTGVNEVLEKENKELVTHTVVGYNQGDRWELSYLANYRTDPARREDIENYLEHDIGAYYRGSLSELVIYDNEMEAQDFYTVDQEEFWDNPVEKVQEITGEKNFIAVETALSLDAKGKELSQDQLETFVHQSPEVQKNILASMQESQKVMDEGLSL